MGVLNWFLGTKEKRIEKKINELRLKERQTNAERNKASSERDEKLTVQKTKELGILMKKISNLQLELENITEKK